MSLAVACLTFDPYRIVLFNDTFNIITLVYRLSGDCITIYTLRGDYRKFEKYVPGQCTNCTIHFQM